MKRHPSPLPARQQHGLGLVEVLVAMTLGLVLLGAVGYLFVGSKQMNSTQSDVLRMQESARNALGTLGRAVRQAGYKLNVDEALDGDALLGTDGGSNAAGTALPDTLTVRHDPAWVADTAVPPNPLSGRETDCSGTEVVSDNLPDAATGAAPVNRTLVEYGFSVAAGKLLCKADGANPAAGGVVMADYIENMQIAYGIGDGAESIVKYTSSPSALEFTRVAAVRVSLLVRGPTPNLVPGKRQSILYNEQVATYTDGHLRQVYTSTFTVRNQIRWK